MISQTNRQKFIDDSINQTLISNVNENKQLLKLILSQQNTKNQNQKGCEVQSTNLNPIDQSKTDLHNYSPFRKYSKPIEDKISNSKNILQTINNLETAEGVENEPQLQNTTDLKLINNLVNVNSIKDLYTLESVDNCTDQHIKTKRKNNVNRNFATQQDMKTAREYQISQASSSIEINQLIQNTENNYHNYLRILSNSKRKGEQQSKIMIQMLKHDLVELQKFKIQQTDFNQVLVEQLLGLDRKIEMFVNEVGRLNAKLDQKNQKLIQLQAYNDQLNQQIKNYQMFLCKKNQQISEQQESFWKDQLKKSNQQLKCMNKQLNKITISNNQMSRKLDQKDSQINEFMKLTNYLLSQQNKEVVKSFSHMNRLDRQQKYSDYILERDIE